VKTCGRALYSPTTSSVDPVEVMRLMSEDASREGVEIRAGVSYHGSNKDSVATSSGEYSAGYVVNAAGLYADKIAKDFGFSQHYSILPFKGLYLYSDEPRGSIRTNIYPVPDLRNPFLGVHYTLTVNNDVKIGPTAIPVFWREQYRGVENFSLPELIEIVYRQLGLFMSSNFDFKKLAAEEIRKYSRTRMVQLASVLIEGVESGRYSGGPSRGSGRSCSITGRGSWRWTSSSRVMPNRFMSSMPCRRHLPVPFRFRSTCATRLTNYCIERAG
jgi:L-2-hydroxyglutarate oxidase